MPKKQKILFLCTGNSCRSQMAEGWTKALKGELFDAYSAGTDPHGMNQLAIESMGLAGVNISSHTSDHLDKYLELEFDYVVTVCDNAQENCPIFSGSGQVVHMGFEDPPALAKDETSESKKLTHFNKVRDQIKDFVLNFPESLNII
jgi:arsenate reductase (thioredoxin)